MPLRFGRLPGRGSRSLPETQTASTRPITHSPRWRSPSTCSQMLCPSVSSQARSLLGGGRLVGGERGDERLLGDLDAADHLHPLLALLLLLQQLALAGDVTAVALG